jgi:NAD-dependent deacetylase
LRPDVVLFGEMLPEEAWAAASAAALQCDLFFAIGTSGVVEPAASLARYAMTTGATVVIINLEVTNRAEENLYQFNGRAGALLPAIVEAAWPATGSQ